MRDSDKMEKWCPNATVGNLMPDSVIQANWYGVFVYNFIVVVAEQLYGVGPGSSATGCFVCDACI